MSLACHPGATFTVTLPSDVDVPEDRRPSFVVRHLSCREWSDLARFADDKEALMALPVHEIVARLLNVIAQHLAGWSDVQSGVPLGAHVPFPCPCESADEVAAALGEVLTLDEAWELYDEIRQGSRLSVTEKNDSTSRSASPTDSSADAGQPPATE